MSGQVPDSRLRPIFDLQPEADQRRGVSEWWGRRGGGVYSVVGRGFLFCLVGRSGDGRRSYVDDAPFTIQRGFGRPGVRTLQARYPICSTAAWTRPGSAVRHGSYTWVGCTALKQPKGAGSSCRPHRRNLSNIAEASGSREQRRKRLRHGGHRGLLGSVRPLRVSA